MGVVRAARPVNLICGLISNDRDLAARAIRLMEQQIGPIDATSEFWVFDQTDYYMLEMGEDLERQFISFEKLIDPVEISHIKLLTNQLEKRICHDLGLPTDRRLVNLDPGYMTLSKLVLATTKDFSHRVYLRDGIYAESTLWYSDGEWHAWPWTYPDYAGPNYKGFLTQVRELLRAKLDALGISGLPRRGGTP